MVGRICCDSEGRLNERSILLEGSVELSNGMRTKLDLSRLDSYKLFPGQVCHLGSNSKRSTASQSVHREPHFACDD